MLGEFRLEEQKRHQRGRRNDPADADFDRLGRGGAGEHYDQREDKRNTQAKAAHQILPVILVLCAKASTGAQGREAAADAALITAASSHRIDSIAKALLAEA